MAKAEKTVVKIEEVVLNLDGEEAGYLLDLLMAHVAGELTRKEQPLGRISEALRGADVVRIRARNTNYTESPTRPYAVLECED